ncbi:hypothetical protein H2204_003511 [Knufia peltigerae]|uniref:Uncharacterized protein n=1 Tax=Knufia peltigerae TaxID=1002370 RepID=A0AA38Y8X0_9EURO|nr:hypothetical protein H2204_003511 [Knufia peltigerae]
MGVHIEHIELYRPLSPPEDQKTTSEGSLSSPPPEQGPSPSVNRYTSSPEQQRGYHDATERQSRSSGYVTPYTMSPSPTSSACVAWMEPCSLLLLQHYLEETSTFLVAKPAHYNPYLTLIVPLAYSDDILMHAVLALSGTQLSFKKGRDHHIHLATRRHYSQTLRSLGPLIAEQSVCEDTERALRIALVSLILCYVEAISGDAGGGGIFLHLRACREMILTVLGSERGRPSNEETRSIKGFVLEVYSFLVLSNRITPYDCCDTARMMPHDPFLDSLDFLQEYKTFGVLLGSVQGLFELIPLASKLALDRLREELEDSQIAAAARRNRCHRRFVYDNLIIVLEQWRSPAVSPEMTEWYLEHSWIGEIYRQALLIFVKISMCGSVVDNPKVIATIQGHIDVVMPLLLPVADSPLGTLLLWPVMVIGSCLIAECQRQFFLNRLYNETKVVVAQVVEAGKLLELVWYDADKRAYGPFGLHLAMKKHKINFGVS